MLPAAQKSSRRLRRAGRGRRLNHVRFAVFSAFLFAASPAFAVGLTPEEQDYLRDNPVVRYCADPDWEPYEVITEQGWHRGIAADLLRLAASRVGLTLSVVPTKTWEESVAVARAGSCRFLSFLNRTPKRDEWLNFTAPLFIDPNVVVTREEHPQVDDLGGLTGEGATMVLPAGTSMEERLTKDFPNLIVTTVDTEAEAFALVSDKRAAMTMRSMIVAVHAVKKGGWFNLKVAGALPGYENRLRVGVVKSEPLLRSILDKGIATITADERLQIANRHVSITVQNNIDYDVLQRVLTACAPAAAVSLFWMFRLRRAKEALRRQSRLDARTGLGSRNYLDEHLSQELKRAHHYSRPFAVIRLDVDHLKAVDDFYGRSMRETVLRECAAAFQATVRDADMSGCWNDDGFMILCPETTAEQASALAQRLCAAVRGRPFPTGHTHTVSAGGAAAAPAETAEDLVRRAEAALRRAQEEGRDRAVVDGASSASFPAALPAASPD